MTFVLRMIPEIFQYDFMIRAFIVGGLLALLTTCIGMVMVLKRLSMVGDALSHTALAGVAAGLLGHFNPLVGAMLASVLAAFGIEWFRKVFHRYSEIGIAIVLSTGIGLAGNLSAFVHQASQFNSFLFGSIIAIDSFEFYLVLIVSTFVLLLAFLFFKELFFITFDEEAASLSGMPVRWVNALFILLTALTIALASRTVGSLVISSLLVIPVAGALQLGKSYRFTLFFSMFSSLIYTFAGLTLSFYYGVKPGSTIVLISVAGFLLLYFYKKIQMRIRSSRQLKKGEIFPPKA